jgi:hypothetical protein
MKIRRAPLNSLCWILDSSSTGSAAFLPPQYMTCARYVDSGEPSALELIDIPFGTRDSRKRSPKNRVASTLSPTNGEGPR